MIVKKIKNEYYFIGEAYFDEDSNDYKFGIPRKENKYMTNLSIYIRK
jgi:hypothetical protein